MRIPLPNLLPVGDSPNSYPTRVANALSALFEIETLRVELLPSVSSSASSSSPHAAVKRLCKEARWLLEPSFPLFSAQMCLLNVTVVRALRAAAQDHSETSC